MMRHWRGAIILAALVASATLAACGGTASTSPAASPLVPFARGFAGATSSGKIQHVVIIIQENRSVDNLFQGYPGANTIPFGKNSTGQIVPLQPISLATKYIIDHSLTAFLSACAGTAQGQNCTNTGFDQEQERNGPLNGQYAYVPRGESKPYFDLAHEFVFADRMFTSQVDESFVAHQYLIAAQASSSVNVPFSIYWGCGGGKGDYVETVLSDRTMGPHVSPCFNNQTLGDELDAAGLSWRFYASKITADGGVWSGYQAIRHIRYGQDWKRDIVVPQTRFFKDIKAGQLANVTWITPICANSDHPNCGGGTGPDWVANLVNAIGASKLWDSTAVLVVWDDWGGLYDHVPPPYLDYDGLGFRAPLIVVSPYAKQSYVSHVQYETTSILRFAEDQFGLGQLAASDARAADPATDCFDFSQPPRAYVPIKTVHDQAFFMQQPDDHRPPDDQ